MSGRLTISPGVLFSEVGGELVLLDLEREAYFGLNEIGARIWRLLEAGHDLPVLLDMLEEEYDAGRAQLEAEVGELIRQLQEAGLIRRD